MFELLKTLCELPGPGGDEGPVQDCLMEKWADRVESIRMTGMGNVIARVGGRGPKLLIGAHADEVGFIVKYISADGYLFLSSGQRDLDQRPSLRSPYAMPIGAPALVLTREGPAEGVFATLTGHILTPYQRQKALLDWNDVWIDIGARSRAQVEIRGVAVGDRVIWNPPTQRMGDLAYGKAMDDRVALVIMDRLLDELDRSRLAYDLTLVSTVQEEIGLIGAESVVGETGCELAIALDIGLAGDVPGVDQRDVSARLGLGPVIVHKDLYNYSRPLTLALEKAADEAHIPYQAAVYSIYGSDAGAFMRHGVPSALITVATRYTHSPFEMLHLRDVELTVRLLKAFLEATGPLVRG